MRREQYRAVLHCERVKRNRVYRVVGNRRVQLVTALHTLMKISENRTMTMCCTVLCCVLCYAVQFAVVVHCTGLLRCVEVVD